MKKVLRAIFKGKQRNPRDEVQNKATLPPSPPSTPKLKQQSIGLSPAPQTQTQKPDEPSDAWRVAKSALTLSLELAEIALSACPVPGAKVPFTIALRIIKGIDASSNAQTLKEIETHVTYIYNDILSPLSKMDDEDIPQGLKTDVERLGSELETLTEGWSSRSSHGKVRRFVTANDDEGGLKHLSQSIQHAVERFQISGQVRGQISAANQEKGIARLENIIIVNKTDAEFRARSELVNRLPRAVQAAYNSGRAGGPTTCFKDTRVAVLKTIKSWISDPNKSLPPVFWLNGMAGIGKSTIAKTVAEYAYDRGILGGSFFFSRDDQQLRDPSLVFPTLAFQLAQSADVFRSLIGKALEKDADYGHRGRLIQLEELIIRPLVQSGLSGSKHVVLLVIDALDECAPEAEAADILRLILAHISRIPFIFRVFLTSRPESHITKVFNEKYNHKKYILHDIEEKIVRDDIHLFIESNLRDLPGRLDVKIKGEWPPTADMEILVDKCGKLFVYAATSLRFIGNDRIRNPLKQLEVLLGARAAVNAKPFAQLDQLYLQVLRSALPEDSREDLIPRFHWVVGSIVLLRDPLSVDSLSRFIKYDAEEVSDALYHLHSIILPPSSFEEAPRIYHPSFYDFITNSSRCSEPTFLVDVPKHEKRLVLRCLDVMLSTLKRDILEIGNSYQLNTEIDSLMKVINEHVPAEVQYSCHHWASHLSKVTIGDEEVINVLAQFAFQKLLNWIEVMSLLNLSGLAVSSMRDAHKWAVQSDCNNGLVEILYDGYRLIFSHQQVIANSAGHVYRTALPFTPKNSLLFKTYKKEADDAVRVLCGVNPQWSPCLSAIHCGGNGAKCVAYTSDGSRIATGLSDNKITLWDAVSASHLMVLEHPGEIMSVTFLLNDTLLASGSSANTIMLWDTISGSSIRTYGEHTMSVNCLSASPKAPHIFASGSADCTIRVWDTTSADCILTMRCHENPVLSVAVLPDGSGILSGSQDGIIRLWDSSTGTELQQFEFHTGAVCSLAINDSKDLRFASASKYGVIKIYSISHKVEVMTYESEHEVHTIAFSSDGEVLAYDAPQNVLVLNCSTGRVSAKFRHQGVAQVALSPQGTRLASASSDSTCRLWDITRPTTEDDHHLGWVTSLAFSENGSWLATGGDHNDKTICLWDSTLGTHARTLRGHIWGVYSLAFSADGRFLASGSGDCTARIWDVQAGHQLLILKEHDVVRGINFSNEGYQVVTRTAKFARTWDLEQVLPTSASFNDSEIEIQVIKDPIASISEVYDKPSGRMGGVSDGFYCGMGGGRWIIMSALPASDYRRVTFIFQEYRICGFAFQHNHVAFVCVDGQVLLLDISRLKREFVADI